MRQWTTPGARIVLGVSGGPDSQALLHCLAAVKAELQLELVAIGIDHGLRSEARKELDLACQLAGEHQVSYETIPVHVEKGKNIMAAARRARYRALRRAAHRHDAVAIALAHTASDQVENVLLNLTRGAGLRGSRGMPARRGAILRPLLGTTRAEILSYLADHDVPFATDPTNADPRRARALLRHNVIPELRSVNPGLEQAFARFARSARDDEALLRRLARQELEARLGVLDSLAVRGFDAIPRPIGVRVLMLWLRKHRLRSNHSGLLGLLRACRTGTGGRTVSGVTLRVEGGRLWRMGAPTIDEPLSAPCSVAIDPLDIRIRGEVLELDEPIGPTTIDAYRVRRADFVAFDWDSLHLDIRVRSWTVGDRFEPFGLDGHTKVGDLFTDKKIPRALRAIWPLVVHGDEVLWVIGLRRGNGAPVQVGSRRILTLTVEGAVPEW